jgi:hypothetical protein
MSLLTRQVKSFLPDGDYLPVAMPTTDVQVLQVLTRQRSVLRRYSELDRVLAPADGAAGPIVASSQPVVNASGMARRSAKIGIGLGIVSEIVKALGAKASLNLSAAGASTVEYGYEEVTSDRVDLASLDGWLAQADFRPGLRNITDLLVAEDVYVIVAALKAQALSITLLDSNQAGVEVDVPIIQAAVGASVSVTAASQRSAHLTFRGDTALTVAAKAAQLRYDEHGFWVNERPVTGAEIRDLSGAGRPIYLDDPELLLS